MFLCDWPPVIIRLYNDSLYSNVLVVIVVHNKLSPCAESLSLHNQLYSLSYQDQQHSCVFWGNLFTKSAVNFNKSRNSRLSLKTSRSRFSQNKHEWCWSWEDGENSWLWRECDLVREDNPGTTTRAIARAMGAGNKTVSKVVHEDNLRP